MNGWIAVDLDGTLARYNAGESWNGETIGEPVPKMVRRVRDWLAEKKEVRIFTARVNLSTHSIEFVQHQVQLISEWCYQHLGAMLPIVCDKDYLTIEIWDDRCVQVVTNTGERADGKE